MLFTSAIAEEPLLEAAPLFLDNELGGADVNTFTGLANAADPVNSLDRATQGDRPASPRYREVMAPLRLGDELRAALVTGSRCWGVMCLHRVESPFGFTDRERQLIRRLGPHLAEGLRRSVLAAPREPPAVEEPGPGVLILDAARNVVSSSAEADYWLAQLYGGGRSSSAEVPLAVSAAAAHLGHPLRGAAPDPAAPLLRLRTRTGRWLTVHASRLSVTAPGESAGQHTAVVLQPGNPAELQSLFLDAHGLGTNTWKLS